MHKSSKCELSRMFNIAQTLGMKTIFIRYNPDFYKLNGQRMNPAKSTRHTELIKTINIMSHQNYDKIEFLNVIYLYYDNYKKQDAKMKPIDITKLFDE